MPMFSFVSIGLDDFDDFDIHISLRLQTLCGVVNKRQTVKVLALRSGLYLKSDINFNLLLFLIMQIKFSFHSCINLYISLYNLFSKLENLLSICSKIHFDKTT